MKLHRRLTLESLEARALLATVGGSWPSPSDLTLSFAPDGTQIGLFENEIFAALGRNRAAGAWQTEVLRAFQTWAAVANVDIGLVPDTGRPFGVAGLAQGDPRFGDIRIGAFPQPRVIASAVPYRAGAGSWSGDVFLNSSLAAGLRSADIDLYSVLLNEAGNSLGLADNSDPESVMFTDYRGQQSGLSSADIADIRSLYGERPPDVYDAAYSNDSAENATTLTPAPAGGARTTSVDADLHRIGDVDYYRIPAFGNGGRISVRLIAAGESLLVGAVEVMRSGGATLAATAAGPLANDVHLNVPITPHHGDVLIRVAAGTNDVFGVGRYRLEIDVRGGGASSPPPASTPTADALLPAAEAAGQARDYPAVTGFLDDESALDDSYSTATLLATPLGYAPLSRYEAVGAIRAADDVDYYRISAPATGDRRLKVSLDTFDVRLIDFCVGLYDANAEPIVEQFVSAADGRVVLDVADIPTGETYYLRIAAGGPGGSSTGNYVVVAEFIREDLFLVPIASGTLATAKQRDVQLWHATRTRLYRFDLRPDGGAVGAAVRFEIRDERGELVLSMRASSSASGTHFIWLSAGSFEFSITPDNAADLDFQSMNYVLTTAALSDDVGPGLVDPTESLLPGDADRSGVVDRGDVAAVASDYGIFAESLPSLADFDGDGDVDLSDLLAVAAHLGRALLPDSWVSTSNGSPSTTGTQAPSAVVRSANGRLVTDAEPAASTWELAAVNRRFPRGSSTPLSASGVRRPIVPRLVDSLLSGETSGASVTRLFATHAAASIRRRSPR